MRQQFIDICTKISQLMLPQQCLLCQAPTDVHQLCPGCTADLPFHDSACCPVCAMPSPQAEVCGSCLKNPPHFDATHAAFAYAYPWDGLLRALKYQGRLTVAELAGTHLANQLGNIQAELIVPMPLHTRRLRERGFNQASEIARTLSRRIGIPYLVDGVFRIRETAPQASLPLKQRAKNMRGAFACQTDFHGKRIAIVDDVMTSGTSLNELARILKVSGASSVECWVAARTLRD